MSSKRSLGPTAAVPVRPDAVVPVRPVAARDANARVRDGVDSPARPLDGDVRQAMERRLGHDFRNVRVHDGPAAAASARALGAEAYAAGRDLVFDAGRYDPRSSDGQRLLAHELAHVAHGASVAERRAGVAPEDALAERMADASSGDPARSTAQGFHGWGPAWEVHRQVDKIDKKGKVEHTGEVGRVPGETGVPTGTVEVRTGEDIEFKGGGKVPNTIALAYSGAISSASRWLQFVWFEMTAIQATGVVKLAGNVGTTSGNKPFTTDPAAPNWSLDNALTTDPFYEPGGANLRDKSSITMFDAPGGASVKPFADLAFARVAGAVMVTFTAHFDTYLIQNNQTAYYVPWQATTVFTPSAGKAVFGGLGYTVGAAGPLFALPAGHKKMLDAAFPAFKHVT